ncbi:MAG: zinc-ribbon and DUF3426 domain-containing protein [Burkholderiaceae bacterium]
MSLATRCTACGTVFRVVQDQLKVSEGWVRCGRCSEVFNALQGLFDLERENAPAWTSSQRGALEVLSGSAEDRAAASAIASQTRDARSDSDEDDSALETRLLDPTDDDRADGRVDEQADDGSAAIQHLDAADGQLAVRSTIADDPADAGPADERDEPGRDPAPDFLRQAEWNDRWHTSRVRAGLRVTAALLVVALGLQWLYTQRDPLSAAQPTLAPALAQMCAVLGCRIEAPRRIESLAVESSGLTQLDDPARVRLQVALRNRDSLPLMTPSLDLSLTDSRGELVARRVLDPRDFGPATPARMAPGAELNLQTVLDTGERRVSGYSVEIFYP